MRDRLCRHPVITVFAEENGPHRMWACADCNLRFYPACETCVSIGHRMEEHDPEWVRLDEERLARALLRAVPGYGRWMTWPVTTHHEAEGRADATESEARVHAAAIIRALREEP